MSARRRRLISAVILVHWAAVAAVLVAQREAPSFFAPPAMSAPLRLIRGYLALTGQRHAWHMFAHLGSGDQRNLTVVVEREDGSARRFDLERAADLPLLRAKWRHRLRRFQHSVLDPRHKAHWAGLARHYVRRATEEGGARPVRVRLVSRRIAPVGLMAPKDVVDWPRLRDRAEVIEVPLGEVSVRWKR